MIWLRQSTASQNVILGALLSFTDMKTVQTGLTINNTDIRIHKAGASVFVVKNSGGATHLFGGYYLATLDATDTNTVGPMMITTFINGVMPWSRPAMVLPAAVYDALVNNTGQIRADVRQFEGAATVMRGGYPVVTMGALHDATLSRTSVVYLAESPTYVYFPPSLLGTTGTTPDWWIAPLNAAGVRTAIGMANPNLDAQLAGLPAGVRTALGMATGNLDAQFAGLPTAVGNADALLGRSIAGGANGGRTVRDALRAARNRVAFDVPGPGQFTVFAEDDTTPAWTGTYNAAVGANPVVGVNPD